MVQVYVFDDLGQRYQLDLYKEDPIKITQSIETINDITQVDSNYSRQFRVPATQNNSQVFKWWYEANTVDFDVTKRVVAEIHVDGILYKTGHIRILSAYRNKKSSQVDLELVFLGETKDFASQIGEITLKDLDLQKWNHGIDASFIRSTWLDQTDPQAFTAVRYILANRGYDYDDAGALLNDAEIADSQHHTKSFQKSQHPLSYKQFTPMVQAKAIIDGIFDQTDYSYSDDSVFNEEWFKDLYIDGIPDPSSEFTDSNGEFEAHSIGQNLRSNQTVIDIVEFPNEISDIGGNYNATTSRYHVPLYGQYTIETRLNLLLRRNILNPTVTYEVEIRRRLNGSDIQLATSGPLTTPAGVTTYPDSVTVTFPNGFLTQDTDSREYVYVRVTFSNSLNHKVDEYSVFEVTSTPNLISVNRFLKYDVKSIDFLKSILTKFKLVMAPSDREYEFTIKPWKDYIGSGDRVDWSNKLDLDKDVKLEPIFYDQSRIIDFTDQQDEDLKNKPFQEEFSRAYGALQFDSKNEMLNQKEEKVETIFAPTPVDVVEGFDSLSSFVIPVFAKQGTAESDHGHLQELPMKIKPRLLFWNGFADIAADEDWWWSDELNNDYHETEGYPRMTPYSEFPTTVDTINLNWFREAPLFNNSDNKVQKHKGVYEAFWNIYVQEIYSPFARKLTAYFNLDSEDLRKASFDDLIFIENAYYRIVKIYDAPLNEIATVKVELIKILDVLEFTTTADPGPGGGGIDPVDPTGGGGSPVDPSDDPTWGGNDNPFGDTGNPSWDGGYYYIVQNCDGSPGTYVAKHNAPIAIGRVVEMSGVPHAGECYEVVDRANGPEDATVLMIYNDCLECQTN